MDHPLTPAPVHSWGRRRLGTNLRSVGFSAICHQEAHPTHDREETGYLTPLKGQGIYITITCGGRELEKIEVLSTQDRALRRILPRLG